MGQIARQPRQEAEFLRMRIGIEVVPVLRIGGRMENKTGDGGERREIPGGRVVPNWKKRLESRRRSCSSGPDLAVTAQTPAKLVVVPHVLAAQFQVMPAERRGEVVADGLGVLQDVDWAGADRIAAQYYDHRTSTQDGMIWEITALPSHAWLILALVVRQAAPDLVHCAVADDVSQRREVLRGHPLPGTAGRGMVRG